MGWFIANAALRLFEHQVLMSRVGEKKHVHFTRHAMLLKRTRYVPRIAGLTHPYLLVHKEFLQMGNGRIIICLTPTFGFLFMRP
jgi:hypothetical protein